MTVEVWGFIFYKLDEEGKPLLNKDGHVKFFQDKNGMIDLDPYLIAVGECMDDDDLEEMSND